MCVIETFQTTFELGGLMFVQLKQLLEISYLEGDSTGDDEQITMMEMKLVRATQPHVVTPPLITFQ